MFVFTGTRKWLPVFFLFSEQACWKLYWDINCIFILCFCFYDSMRFFGGERKDVKMINICLNQLCCWRDVTCGLPLSAIVWDIFSNYEKTVAPRNFKFFVHVAESVLKMSVLRFLLHHAYFCCIKDAFHILINLGRRRPNH